jgi:hypothetical protein
MPRYLVLDIHCQPCRPGWRDGGPNPPPRLARFVRDVRGGPIKTQTFTYKGQTVTALPHQRPDGGVTWQTHCPHGHDKPIQEWRIVAAFDAFLPGTDSARIAL